MKQVEVVAAVIKKDNKILATQRGYGEFAGGWEFPGGKPELGETKEQALALDNKYKEIMDKNHIPYMELDNVDACDYIIKYFNIKYTPRNKS